MGFLFSRKPEQQDAYLQPGTSVVQVIRSRFYGKHKLKNRSSRTTPPLSPNHITTSTLRSRPINNGTATAPSSPLVSHATRELLPSKPRPVSDAITMTLAQRLNELAVANSEGLLDDDEYRLLRHNLFERFASGATVPVEVPVVPVTRKTPSQDRSSLGPTEVPLSNFHVTTPRSPSLRSKASVGSAMTNLFRRATARSSTRNADSDCSSLFSVKSTASHAFLRPSPSQPPTRKNSSASLRTEASRNNFDTLSIISRKTATRSERIGPYDNNASTISLPRSSRRTFPTSPPSSFPSRVAGIDMKQLVSGKLHGVFDADNLTTAAEIRQEIENVEGEGKRLLDAFNGLEISTLTKRQNRSGCGPMVRDAIDSTWTLVPDRRPLRRGPDSDTTSLLSNDSSRTSPSIAMSTRSSRRTPLSPVKSNAASIPPVPSLPSSPAAVADDDVSSSSSLSLARSRSHRALRSLVESDELSEMDSHEEGDAFVLDKELSDIRRRREEVLDRYEARLDYLRAKLKGAEIHEKLLRK